MSELRCYSDYKDSGVPWLGEVPSHWEVKQLKHLVTYNDETLSDKTDPLYEFQYVDISSVSLIDGITNKNSLTFDNSPSRARRIVKKGDVIVSTVRTYLKAIAQVEDDANDLIVSTGFAVLRPRKELLPKYLGYWVQSEYIVSSIMSKSVGVSYPAINATDLVRLPVVALPQLEQQAIVNFLDTELERIDTLISKQQQLIEKLAEQRSAVITYAVTKGLDSDVPMKDSGVEWLGEIPEHWKATKLKYYFDIQLGKMLQPNSTSSDDFEVNYLKAMHVQWDNVKVIDLPQMWCNERELEKYEVYNGDLLICEGGEVGRSALIRDLEGTTIIQNALHRLRSTNSGDVRYLDYLIIHIADSEWFSILCNKATIAHLTGDKLANTFITLPPLTEQIKIIDYLDSQTQKMDQMSNSNKNIIAKLQEYRSALITQAVTGKIDVRDISKGNRIEEVA